MAPTGHRLTQIPQLIHFLVSINGTFLTLSQAIASTGQTFIDLSLGKSLILSHSISSLLKYKHLGFIHFKQPI